MYYAEIYDQKNAKICVTNLLPVIKILLSQYFDWTRMQARTKIRIEKFSHPKHICFGSLYNIT